MPQVHPALTTSKAPQYCMRCGELVQSLNPVGMCGSCLTITGLRRYPAVKKERTDLYDAHVNAWLADIPF